MSSNTSTTPRQWAYQPTAGHHQFLIYDETSAHTVALVYDYDQANARLIAAAPELLVLLQRMTAAVRLYQAAHPGDTLAALDEATALLARIDGGA